MKRKKNIGVMILGIMILVPSVAHGLSIGDAGYEHYVIGVGDSQPIIWYNHSIGNSGIFVNESGLYVYLNNNEWFNISGNVSGGSGTSDHGSLTGLGDHDHDQYPLHTELDSESELESAISDVTDFWNNNDFADNSGNWNNVYTDHYTTLGLDDLTAGEVNQLENIGINAISNTEWSYLAVLNQNLRTTDDVEHDELTADICTFQQVNVRETGTGNTAVICEAGSSDIASYEWLMYNDEVWKYYVDDTNPDFFYLSYTDSVGTHIGLQSNLLTIFPPSDEICWGLAGASPTNGMTLQNLNNVFGRAKAYAWDTYSNENFKEIWKEIPKQKLLGVFENITVYMFYWKDYYKNESGEWIIGNTNFSKLDIGIMAETVYTYLYNTFGSQIANVICFYDANSDDWSVSYSKLNLLAFSGCSYIIEYMLDLNNQIKDLKYRVTLLEEEVFG